MIVISGARVASPNGHNGSFLDLVIDKDEIVDIVVPGQGPEDSDRLDARGMLIIPGLINSHTHGHGNMAKGFVDRWSLEVFLNWAPISIGRDANYHRLSALVGACEMVRKGCTAAYDLFSAYPRPSLETMDAVASAYEQVGMRAVIAPMMADRSLYAAMPGLMGSLPPELQKVAAEVKYASAKDNVDACRHMARNWSRSSSQIKLAFAPTIPHHCSSELLLGIRDIAAETGLGIHMHIHESKPDAVSAKHYYGMTATSYLNSLGMLSPSFVGAHCVWLNEEDISIFADTGAMIAHNPGANMKLGSGVAPIRDMLNCGVVVGVGTDGSRSSDNQNMFEATRMSSFVSRLLGYDERRWISAEESFYAATSAGAKLLGWEGKIGEIRAGAKADLVFLRLSDANFLPLNNAVRQIVYCEDGAAVDTVMIGGKVVFEKGNFLNFDMELLEREVNDAAQRLAELNRGLTESLSALHPYVEASSAHLKRQPCGVERLMMVPGA